MAMRPPMVACQYLSASPLPESPGDYRDLEGGKGIGDARVIKVLQKLHSVT